MQEAYAKEQQLEIQSQQLVQQFSQTEDEDERTRLRDELQATLDKQFELQQQRREFEVKRIEDRVNKLKELIKKRNSMREKIIEARLMQLTSDAEGLGWTSVSSGGWAQWQAYPEGFTGRYPTLAPPQKSGFDHPGDAPGAR